jgi:hypothetical protein
MEVEMASEQGTANGVGGSIPWPAVIAAAVALVVILAGLLIWK